MAHPTAVSHRHPLEITIEATHQEDTLKVSQKEGHLHHKQIEEAYRHGRHNLDLICNQHAPTHRNHQHILHHRQQGMRRRSRTPKQPRPPLVIMLIKLPSRQKQQQDILASIRRAATNAVCKWIRNLPLRQSFRHSSTTSHCPQQLGQIASTKDSAKGHFLFWTPSGFFLWTWYRSIKFCLKMPT